MVNIRIISSNGDYDFPYGDHTTVICQRVGNDNRISVSIGSGGVEFAEYKTTARAKEVMKAFREWVENISYKAEFPIEKYARQYGSFVYYQFPKE